MSDAVASTLGIVAFLALFVGVGLLFIFVNLLVGRFLRPADPHEEKQEIYECGEPTIGSSYVQFDLRFYVVALLFIIFDVEVAFFFPWATVFGKTTHLADENLVVVTGSDQEVRLTTDSRRLYQELGVQQPMVPTAIPATLKKDLAAGGTSGAAAPAQSEKQKSRVIHGGARQFGMVTIIDIAVFFGVLLVGFAYVWRRGDLDWVRAVSRERSQQSGRAPPGGEESASKDTVLSA